MKASFCQVIIRPGFKAPQTVFFAVLIRNNHHRHFLEHRVRLDRPDEIDAVHTGHIHQKSEGQKTAPSEYSNRPHRQLSRHNFVAGSFQKPALTSRTVSESSTMRTRFFLPLPQAFFADFLELSGSQQLVDGTHQIVRIKNDNR